MIEAAKAVVWTRYPIKTVLVHRKGDFKPPLLEGWGDPIGASYSDWKAMTNKQRIQAMMETAITLALEGYDLRMVLDEFAKVEGFPKWES